MTRTLFAASWRDGLFVVSGDAVRHELPQRPVRGLFADAQGILAIVDGTQLCRRTPDGRWQTLASSELPLSCVHATPDAVLFDPPR